MMWPPTRGLHGWRVVISHVITCFAIIQNGSSTKCDSSQFACQNHGCIPLSKRNNGVNDCRDNSDEVLFPCRPPAFSCLSRLRCISMEQVLDGQPDCVDNSDEAKVIGADCSLVPTCCDCEEYVANSFCDRGICQCQLGFHANSLGTVCISSGVGDACTVHEDCSASLTNSLCTSGRCRCDTGFQSSQNKSTCDQKVIGDHCTSEAECSTVIDNSRCNNKDQCICSEGYLHSLNRSICIRIDDPRSRILASTKAGSRMKCTDESCETPWGLVAGVLSVIFLLLLGLLVLEICWKKKSVVRKRIRLPHGVMVDNPDAPTTEQTPRPEGERRVRLKGTPTVHKLQRIPSPESILDTGTESESAIEDYDSDYEQA